MTRTCLFLFLVVSVLMAPAGVVSGDEHAVALAPGKASSKLAPRYSPKGYRVPLKPQECDLEGCDHCAGRLMLGPETTQGDGRLLVLARSANGKPFDRLWIDANGDGAVSDDGVQQAQPRAKRDTIYTSFSAQVNVNHGSQEEPVWEPYPIGLWAVVESEQETPTFIRYSRRGFLEGTVSIGEVPHHVVLSDANNDAVFGSGDWWTLLPAGGARINDIAASRKVGDFLWAAGTAWKFELEGTAGRSGRIAPFDPGITPEEDARKRDRYWDDKHVERAAKPLAFEHEADSAIEDARTRGAPYFLDFETVWCGPCKSMDRWVYTAGNVVAAAKGIVCVKVDGDKRKDLKERHSVKSFPTGILFDAHGKELARFTGYQSCVQMVAFLGKAHELRR